MGENSHIEWCDHTFNPWEGCTKVSPGCAHCYAEARNIRFTGGANWGKGAPRRRTSATNWKQPLRWNAEADEDTGDSGLPSALGHRRPRVFCASLADWLDEEVPIEWLADLLYLIHRTPNLDWLLLTKRPQNWDKRVGAACSWMSPLGPFAETKTWLFRWLGGLERENHVAPANIWIGTTVEDQQRADERIPHLISIPARVRFLSCEPLLGPVDLRKDGWLCTAHHINRPEEHPEWDIGPGIIDWVIVGGESGKGARPMHPAWVEDIRHLCTSIGIPLFFKQWGEWYPAENNGGCLEARFPAGTDMGQVPDHPQFHSFTDDQPMVRIGKSAAGRLLRGQEYGEFPKP